MLSGHTARTGGWCDHIASLLAGIALGRRCDRIASLLVRLALASLSLVFDLCLELLLGTKGYRQFLRKAANVWIFY